MTLPLVLAVRPEALAVIVRVPAVLKMKLDKVRVLETSVMLPVVPPLSSAMVALLSLAVIVTLGTALPARFQFASTALTTMPLAMAVPAIWSSGVPVLPVGVPGAAVSPGSRTSNLVAASAVTVKTPSTKVKL